MMMAMLLIFSVGETSALAEELFDSASAKEHFNAGLDLYFKKDYMDAIKEFEAATQFDPDNANAYYFMGYSYYKLKDMEKAMMVFQQAYDTDAKYTPIRNVPPEGPAAGQE